MKVAIAISSKFNSEETIGKALTTAHIKHKLTEITIGGTITDKETVIYSWAKIRDIPVNRVFRIHSYAGGYLPQVKANNDTLLSNDFLLIFEGMEKRSQVIRGLINIAIRHNKPVIIFKENGKGYRFIKKIKDKEVKK